MKKKMKFYPLQIGQENNLDFVKDFCALIPYLVSGKGIYFYFLNY